MSSVFRDALAKIRGLEVRFDELMGLHTTYKVGGPCAAWIDVGSTEALAELLALCAREEVPWLVMGNGSNVLFADRGFDGVVLHLGEGFDHLGLERDLHGPGVHRVEAGAALSITRLLRFAKVEALAGLECLGGVPGTIGGAVRMNAGTVLGEVADSLEAAKVAQAGEAPRWLPTEDLGLGYRRSRLPVGALVTAARFRATDADLAMRQRMREVLAYRKRTQPLQAPSCGSVFANPEGDHAGRLIEAAGLKGRRIGGAQVSEQHANWILNAGDATAADVRALIELCRAEVQAQSGITLRHEVRLLGDWAGADEEGAA